MYSMWVITHMFSLYYGNVFFLSPTIIIHWLTQPDVTLSCPRTPLIIQALTLIYLTLFPSLTRSLSQHHLRPSQNPCSTETSIMESCLLDTCATYWRSKTCVSSVFYTICDLSACHALINVYMPMNVVPNSSACYVTLGSKEEIGEGLRRIIAVGKSGSSTGWRESRDYFELFGFQIGHENGWWIRWYFPIRFGFRCNIYWQIWM